MVSYEIPFAGQEVDTSDPSGSLMNMGESIAAFGTLFVITSAAAYAYNRMKAAAGVDSEVDIPGG